jgi:Rad3-related DNA helicase
MRSFPYQTIRDEQRSAIEFTLDAFVKNGKRFVILELPTGCGKSGIGLTVARELEHLHAKGADFKSGAYFLTTQKVLQDQYANDFSSMKSIKSSTNYECNYHKKQSCSESKKMLKVEPEGSRFSKTCSGISCKYTQAKMAFMNALESVTNFPYFMTEANFSGGITPRHVLVIDEAHNLELELSKFVEITISEYFSNNVLKLEFGEINTQKQAIRWIKEIYLPKVESHCAHIEMMLAKFEKIKEKMKEFVSLTKQVEMLQGHKQKIKKFINIYSEDNWVMNDIPPDERTNAGRKLEFKVIDVSPFSQDQIFRFGEKVLLMSATIINKNSFCESLGIPQDQAEFMTLPSPFPVENRPIFFVPVGKMGMKEIDETLPKLVEGIKFILDSHPNEKGIIHAHTYKIANYIKKNIRSSRLIMHDSTNREEMLAKHMSSDKPTVIISPSMTEGVDLKDDASRFQILCKVPYPYLGDKLCRKRMNKWSWWYPTQVTKIIIQATGRSVRTMDDHAVTYILDEDWKVFFGRNKDLFPVDFRSAIQT